MGALALLLASAASADTTRILPLKHRCADELIPVLRPLLDEGGALTSSQCQLIVRSSARNLREIEQALLALDVARRQFRIGVRQGRVRTGNETRVGVSGEVGNDRVRVRLPRSPDSGGSTTIRRDGLQVETRQTRTRSEFNTNQFILALDGTHAFVRIGQSLPHIRRVLILSGNQALLADEIVYRDVVSGFDVMPRAVGDKVEVTITPRLARLGSPGSNIVDFQQYSITVMVEAGEWLDLGGIAGNGVELRRAILDSRDTTDAEQSTVFIKID